MDWVKNIAKVALVKCAVYGIAIFYVSLAAIVLLFKRLIKGKEFWTVKERTLPPLCLQDSAYGRHSYIKLKDVKIHYVENGDRSKPLMLFVHGFPEFWFCWRNQLKYFAKDYWVVALDMRGYGDSDKPTKVSAYSMDILKKDVYDFVKALRRDTCILIGHDWGGAICWGVAATYPDIVDKLVILNAPHPGSFQKKIQSSLKQFFKSWYIFAFQLPYLPELYFQTDDLEVFRDMFENKIGEEELEGYKYNWSRKGAWTPPINYYRNAMDAKGLLNPVKLPKITAPTLIVWGENDLALERDLPELSRPFVENIKIHYVLNANHFVQQDRPDEVNKAIEDFVTS